MGKNSVVDDIAKGDPFGGGRRAANAAQRSALAAQAQAQANYNEVASIVNPATVEGLLSLDKDIANQDKNLARQEQLISQLDPTIIEASQQALKLLRGEESATLSPLKNQRAQQRAKLLASLREQLGPGAETSTAGIQALNRFDSESANLFGGAQQNALTTLGGLSSQFSSQRPDMFREIMGLSNLGQAKTGLKFQQAGMLSNARNGLQQTAGAENVAALMRGNQDLAWGRQLSSAALTGGIGALTSNPGAGYDTARKTPSGTFYSNS